MKQQAAIRAQGIVRRYGDITALKDFDFELSSGKVTALLGPNGAGKSTFVDLVLGRARAEAGTISVLGHAPGSREARARIGAMLQSAMLHPQLTAREHIVLHSGYYANPRSIDEVLQTAGLSLLASRRYGRLSGGEQRRVQFALAICGRPDLLVLDEPTTALDLDSKTALWRTVRQSALDGTAVLLTTHQLEEAEALADDIVLLTNGRVVAQGTPDAIRMRVGFRRIRCMTCLPEHVLLALPGVHSTRQQGRHQLVHSTNPQQTLKALLAADPSLSDVEVTGASLEDAIHELIRQEAA